MTKTKKPIDITGKLPPVHVRKPWRQKLPEVYAERVDALKDIKGGLVDAIARLKGIQRVFHDYTPNDRREEFEMERLQEQVTAALVLLECADEKLLHTIPIEEIMSAEDLAEMGVR
jgi:hypothetical protein